MIRRPRRSTLFPYTPLFRSTIRELAEYTGLSPAAVSYALRGMQVSADTEQRVREAAEKLGYEADPIARALAGGATAVVGLRSEEHTSELQSQSNLVCRLLPA